MCTERRQANKLTIRLYCGFFILSSVIIFCTAGLAAAETYSATVLQNTSGTKQIEAGSAITTIDEHGMHAENSGAVISADDGLSITASTTAEWEIAYGAYAHMGGTIQIGDSAEIEVSGNTALGASAVDHSTITIGSGAQITAAGERANGAYADSGSKITIGGGAVIKTTGEQGHGLFAEGSDTNITVGNGAAITASGISANGAFANEGSSINIGSETKITASGESVRGAIAKSNSYMNIGQSVDITALGDQSYGVSAQTYSNMDIGANASITASGYNASGVIAHDSSSISIGAAAVITTSEGSSSAIYAASASNISIGEGAVITNYDSSAIGAYAFNNSKIDIGSSAKITTSGIYAFGAQAQSNAGIDIGSSANIATMGDEAHGLYAHDNSYIKIDADANIATTGSEAHAIYAYDSGSILLNGATLSAAGADSLAVYSKLNSQVTGTGKFNITGDMYADGTGSTADTLIDLTLKDGSTFTGKTSYTNAITGTKLNLTLNGANSKWLMTENSLLTNLDNTGIVDYTASGVFTTLTTENLSGTGLFIMKSDIVNQQADNLIVTGTTSGSHLISVINNGSAATTGDEITRLVMTADTNGNFALVNDAVELGAWKYKLRQNTTYGGDGAEWELYGVGELSDPADDASGTFMGSYMLAYAETTFMQRMGDLRSSPHLAGLWARTYGGQFENKAADSRNHFDMDVFGINIGYDRKLEIGWKGDLYVGGFFGYSHGDMDYNNGGSGTIESQMIGLYASFVSPGGFYADSVLKYRWRSSDFDTYDSAGDHVTSNKIHTAGFGWSLELGQRISVSGTPKNGWYMEPQVQIRHQRHDDGYYTLSNGLRIGTEGFTSIIGRVGALIGYETADRNFYVKVFRAKEFDGELNVYANGERIDQSIGGSWWIYGLGYTTKLSDRNSLYLDLERTSGADFEQKWRLNLGWRMEF